LTLYNFEHHNKIVMNQNPGPSLYSCISPFICNPYWLVQWPRVHSKEGDFH